MDAPPADDAQPTAAGEARVVLPCEQLAPVLDVLVERLGFRLDAISPADDPQRALLSGHGLRLELRRGTESPPATLHLAGPAAATYGAPGEVLVLPNGTRVELGRPPAPPALPPLPADPRLLVARADDGTPWVTGRAGMRYRDVLPGRLGGRVVASLIAIPDGGPVPDHVHHHAVRFQLIVCRRGEVRVLYEDQGPALVLEPGDLVLQPPGIRHRVLVSSPGLEVLEVTSPAEHDTFLDHELALPTDALRPDRTFGGQRFVHHVARDAPWHPAGRQGWEAQDTGIAGATDGLASVVVLRPAAALSGGAHQDATWRHDGELLFLHLLAGGATLCCADHEPARLATGDSATVPPGLEVTLQGPTPDLRLLEVRLPAAPSIR